MLSEPADNPVKHHGNTRDDHPEGVDQTIRSDEQAQGNRDRVEGSFRKVFTGILLHCDSGFRLAYELRKREHLAGVPLVMLSGVARETGERFDQEGKGLLNWSKLDRFVDKPATGKQLLAVAEELLS